MPPSRLVCSSKPVATKRYSAVALSRRMSGLFALSVCLLLGLACDQSPSGGDGVPTWAKSYGGPAWDTAAQTIPTRDGGFVMVGTRNMVCWESAVLPGCYGEVFAGDAWVIKLDAAGNVEWERTYGEATDGIKAWGDKITSAKEAPDGSIWLAGERSEAGTLPQEQKTDLWAARITPAGALHCSGGFDSGTFPAPEPGPGSTQTTHERRAVAHPTAGGGVFIAAEAISWSGPFSDSVSGLNILSLDEDCVAQWNHVYALGGKAGFLGSGDYIDDYGAGAGFVVMSGGDTPKVVRIGSDGSLGWQVGVDEIFEGAGKFNIHSVAADPADGGVVLVGSYEAEGAMAKLTSNGAIDWTASDFPNQFNDIAARCLDEGAGLVCTFAVTRFDDQVQTITAAGDVIDSHTLPEGVGAAIQWVQATDRFHALAKEVLDDEKSLFYASILTSVLAQVSTAQLAEEDTPGQSSLWIESSPRPAGGWMLRSDHEVVLFNAAAQAEREESFPQGDAETLDRGWSIAERDTGGYTVVASHVYTPWLFQIAEDGGEISAGAVEGLPQLTTNAWTPLRRSKADEDDPGAVSDIRDESHEYHRTLPISVALADGGAVIGIDHRSRRFTRTQATQVVRVDEAGEVLWESDRLGGALRAIELATNGQVWVATVGSSTKDADLYLTLLEDDGSVVFGRGYDLFDAPSYSGFEGATHLLAQEEGVMIAGTIRRPSGYDALDIEGDALFVMKLDAAGDVVWSRTYDFAGLDRFDDARLAQGPEGSLVLGSTWMIDPYGPGAPPGLYARTGRRNLALAGLDAEGEVQWSRTYGGLYNERLNSLTALEDGLVVSTRSDSLGDLGEAWVLRLGPDGLVTEGCNALIDRGFPLESAVLEASIEAPRETSAAIETTIDETELPSHVVAEGSIVARQCSGAFDPDAGEPDPRHLSVTVDGFGSGVVRSILPGGAILCGNLASSVCEADLERGSVIVLAPELDGNAGFGGWIGCDDVINDDQCRLTLDTDRSVTAYVYSADEIVTFDVNPVGLGRVDSSGDIVRCGTVGGTCSADVAPQSPFNMTAIPDPPNSFIAWGGDCASFGTGTIVSIPRVQGLSSPQTCVAEFTARRDVDLFITGGAGLPIIQIPTEVIIVNFSTTVTLDAGDVVPIEAVPRGTDGFNRWACYRRGEPRSNPDISYRKELDLDVDRWERCDAQFLREDQGRRLNLFLDPTLNTNESRFHNVRVYSAPGRVGTSAGHGCVEDCSVIFDTGELVALTPVPEFGYTDIIDHIWEGCASTRASLMTQFDGAPVLECLVTLDELRNVTLRYEAGGNSGAPDAPNVTFDWTPEADVEVSDVVSFDSTGTFGLTPLTYLWDFENAGADNGSNFGPTPSHTYTTAGTRQVRLRVFDARGRMGQAVGSINVGTGIPRDPIQVFVIGTGSGSVTFDPERTACTQNCFHDFDRGSDVKLIAEADPGSQFVAWSGNAECIDGTVGLETTVQVPEFGLACTVTFDSLVPPKRTLEVTFAGDGGGTLTFKPGQSDEMVCTDTCSIEYDHGTQALFIFQSNPGSSIPMWTGDPDCGDTDAFITFDADMACTLTVNELPPPPEYTLQVNLAGTGTGNVASNPAGIACPSADCAADYVAGSAIVLTATSDLTSDFVGWSGDAACTNSVTGNQTIIEPIENVTCTATFDLKVVGGMERLTVETSGAGAGRIYGGGQSGGQINCGFDCAEDFPTGESVMLTAEPEPGNEFDGWYGDLACQEGSDGYSVFLDMDEPIHCDARFVPADPGTLAVVNTGFGYGTVEISPGEDCYFTGPTSTPRTPCQGGYGGGVFYVEITATPDEGSVFNGYTDCDAVIDGVCHVVMNNVTRIVEVDFGS